MRKIFKSGSVGGRLGNRRLYPEAAQAIERPFKVCFTFGGHLDSSFISLWQPPGSSDLAARGLLLGDLG